MTARELQTLLQSAPPPQLIHVLPPEIYAAARIPGSQNACVYEMAFLDQIKALVPDPSVSIVVYGAGEGSLDATTAAEKLRAAGYSKIQPFEGGLAEWQAAQLPLEGTGTVKLASGEIILRQGQLVSARFTIDMTSIANDDLADPAYKAMLIAHLRSDDFFDVEHHPTAQFVADTVEKLTGSTEGTPNYLLRGTFTLRGISHPLEFPVLIATTEDGQSLTGQGQLELDRTAYGSKYGSGKLFRFLGKHLVNDCIHLHVKIHAENRR
jgi:polyisoprenoid-binding protein YceI